MDKTDILVIGSLNADLVVRVPRFPAPGETISGSDLATIPGGKGANQAVAAARLGAKVRMLGRVGNDGMGEMLIDNLRQNSVDTASVYRDEQAATGTAVILVDEQGQNSIVLSPGANGQVNREDVTKRGNPGFQGAEFALLQLEIPLETVETAAAFCWVNDIIVFLNPAPARPLPEDLLKSIDVLIPNETELSILSGMPVQNVESAEAAARKLMEVGTFSVLVTLGDKGALYVRRDDPSRYIPAFQVEAVDTTAAGDAFIGGFVAAQVNGYSGDVFRYASACGALATTKFGAQPSLPTAAEVEAFLEAHKE